MRLLQAMCVAATWAVMAASAAEEPFDACQVLTQADAQKALGAAAEEAVNPKAKRPRVVMGCTYRGTRDGKPVEARAQFHFARTEAEAERAFDQTKLQLATKPLLIKGADASFWSAKTGQMYVRKGRASVTLAVGSPNVKERDVDSVRALAETIAAKL